MELEQDRNRIGNISREHRGASGGDGEGREEERKHARMENGVLRWESESSQSDRCIDLPDDMTYHTGIHIYIYRHKYTYTHAHTCTPTRIHG